MFFETEVFLKKDTSVFFQLPPKPRDQLRLETAYTIAGNGNRVVFNISVAAFRASSAANNTLVQNFLNNAALTRMEIAFMFLVTLDDGQEIIPVQARVFLLK